MTVLADPVGLDGLSWTITALITAVSAWRLFAIDARDPWWPIIAVLALAAAATASGRTVGAGWMLSVVVAVGALLAFAGSTWVRERLRPPGGALLAVSTICGVCALTLAIHAAFGPADGRYGRIACLLTSASLGALASRCLFGVVIDNPRLNLVTRRLATAKARAASLVSPPPFVSVLVPCYAEPPELVIRTLEALAGLTYPRYEVVVIDNNTCDPALWQPVERRCTQFGAHFRFFHVEGLTGAKAGALNYAHERLDPRTTVLALVDADYVAEPDFLARFVPLLDGKRVAFVQASHDYRGWEGSAFGRGCYFEYVRFHKLSMVGINETGLGFPVGTMVVLDREAVERVGGWAEWCLTEDSEISIRLGAQGCGGLTLGDTAGRGLLPFGFADVKKQVFRWSAGPMEQLIAYRRHYLGAVRRSSLRGGIKAVLTLRNHLHYLPVAARPFYVVALVALSSVGLGAGPALPLPTGLFGLWLARRIYKAGERWISVRAMGGDARDLLSSLCVERAVEPIKVWATLSPVLGVRMSWIRTPKFPNMGGIGQAVRAALPETICGTVLMLTAAGLALTTPTAASLGGYAALEAAWLGGGYLLALWASLEGARREPILAAPASA